MARAERRAWPQRGFTLSPPVAGLVRIGGHLTVEDAAIVSAALDPLSGPGMHTDARSPAQCRADALVEVCQLALRTGELPDNGGEPPQLAVTVAYDPLARQVRTGRLDNGDRVSPATVRRVACDARVLPVVLSGAGHVLDAGRARRLATGPLRRALVVRDRGCAFPDCDRPPRWCEAHHLRSWTAGGRTDLSNLVLLCRRHHRLIHDGHWTARIGADGLPEFLPPPVLGTPRHPRRNAITDAHRPNRPQPSTWEAFSASRPVRLRWRSKANEHAYAEVVRQRSHAEVVRQRWSGPVRAMRRRVIYGRSARGTSAHVLIRRGVESALGG